MDTDQPLASSPTLCRFESSITRDVAMAINELLIDVFIESHVFSPEILILDFDATDDPIHDHQEGRFSMETPVSSGGRPIEYQLIFEVLPRHGKQWG